MARLARLVIPGLPHHVTQRGNRRQQTFFCAEDYAAYVELMAHRRYTRRINFREKWRGYLWQGPFASFVMDEPYLLAIVNDWRALLDNASGEEELQDLRDHVRTSHPLGSATFVERLEQAAGRVLRARKPGRPAKLLKESN